MINVLITSSSSFIGKNLLELFAKNKSIGLFSLNRSQLDIRKSDTFVDFVKENKIDFIVNTAVSLVDFTNNIQISYSLFKASHYCKAVLMLGSGIEYNPVRYSPRMKENYFDVTAYPLDDNPYHNSKFITACLHQTMNLSNVYNFRLFGVFGKYENYKRRLISNNIYQYLTKGSLSFNRDIAFDYLDVKDLARALMSFMSFMSNSGKPRFTTYNICTGKPVKFSIIMNDIVKFYNADTSIISRIDNSPSDYEYSGDPTRFEDEFNMQILRTTFQDSIQSLNDWLSDIPEVKQLITR